MKALLSPSPESTRQWEAKCWKFSAVTEHRDGVTVLGRGEPQAQKGSPQTHGETKTGISAPLKAKRATKKRAFFLENKAKV